MTLPLHFIGAGPGDAELITVKGARLLGAADVVVYAGSLVDRELVRRYAPQAEVHDSAGLTLAETTRLLAEAVAAGKRAVRLHTGDPSLYGAIQEQMQELDRRGIGYEVVPGVTSAFAAAAALQQELTLPEVSQTVIVTRLAGCTPVPEREQLHRIAQLGATLVIYLSVGMIEDVIAQLLQGVYTAATPVAVVARASWPDQRIVAGTLADIAGKVRAAGIDRQAVILVGDVLKARQEGLAAVSKLYAGTFAHGYRNQSAERPAPGPQPPAPSPRFTMNLAIIALTRNGARLGARLQTARPEAQLFVLERFAGDGGPKVTPFSGELKELVTRLWGRHNAFAFIMATGIVVRMIAPHLAGKGKDPAVVVLDEAGRFAVSLLAGHLGGANRLAVELATAAGGTPVITTATDVNGLTAWDEAARQAGLRVEPLAHIKNLNSLLLEGGRIALVDRRGRVAPYFANTPGIEVHGNFAAALHSGASGLVFVTHRLIPDLDRRPNLLVLRPRDLVVGIGCNRGTSADEIEAAVANELGRAFLAFASIGRLASIIDKGDEPGLREFAARHTLTLEFFTAAQLNAVAAPSPDSRHALAAVGARGVCEPAAILAAGDGPLLITKKMSGNVTVAIAERID